MKITKRDIEALKWIAQLKYLSTSLIAKYFFDDKIKVARRRLKYLFDNGYLLWFEKMQVDSRGRWERVYYLNKKRKPEINCLGGIEFSFYHPPKNPLFANHDLEIANFILCLKTCCDNHGEYTFYHQLGNETRAVRKSNPEEDNQQSGLPFIGRNKAVFIPDALIVLQARIGKCLLFLEIDTGKEVITGSFRNTADISKKLKAYKDYLSCKGYHAFANKHNFNFKGFRVLFVTSQERINHIQDLCKKIDTQGIVWITSFDKINQGSLFNPIWHVPCAEKNELMAIVKKN